jgi:hypothetical protein
MSDRQSALTFNRLIVEEPGARSCLQRTHIRRINDLLELVWTRGWSSQPRIEAGEILRAGAKGLSMRGFDDYTAWTERLETLATALRHEARLNPLGKTIAYGQLVRMVRLRMKLEMLWQRYPHILDLPVAAPIIVLGHMRAGTTRMQRMLASDQSLSATRFCDSWYPLPPGKIDWRPAKAWAVLRSIKLINPEFSSIHPTAPTAVDEEIGWLGLGFSSTPFDAQWRIPSFVDFNNKRRATSTYHLLKRLIQTQQWRNKTEVRPHVLKVPQFMEDIDALLSVFPEACIVHVTRDPLAVVASSCSLVANQRTLQSDNVDLPEIGREWLDRTERREIIAKQRLKGHKYPVVEMGYDQMNTDWREAISGVYKNLGMRLTKETLNHMERFRTKPKATHNPHRYRLEDFGLTADSVLQRFPIQMPRIGE